MAVKVQALERWVTTLIGLALMTSLAGTLLGALHLADTFLGQVAAFETIYVLIIGFSILRLPPTRTLFWCLGSLVVALAAALLQRWDVDPVSLMLFYGFPLVVCALNGYMLDASARGSYANNLLLGRESARLRQWRDNADRMLDQLDVRIRERHEQAGELAFLLEPDLKLSQGGLRDLHCLQWIDLADPSLLEDSEREALDGPHGVLLSARIELHRATGRANNQLLLQEQDEVADALGYGDADLLMAAVAEAARTVTGIEDAVLHRIHNRGRRRRWLARTRDLGHGILLAEETLTLADDAPVSDPVMPLRVAVHAAREDAFIFRDVLDRIAAEDAPLPNPWPDEARELFVDLLLLGHDMIRVVEALDQVDLVTRLIPEWAPNRHRPQRNAYHRFTVDRHLLEAAAEAARLVDRVERPDLLVLGGLFHDIGKGYPGDHSEVGVGLVHTIAERMGYPP
ncbi:MAG TPA: hypothetical protein DEA70_06050, partial [Acidimicrobiaceae bacterium]|nr:hypothetical protein [Acidimicrobiaceae bacterium]